MRPPWRVLFPALLVCWACAGQHEPATSPAPGAPSASPGSAAPSASFAPYTPREPEDPSTGTRFMVPCAPEASESPEDVCRALDLTGDGRPDVIERRRKDWVIVKRLDLNNDGAPDQWVWTPDRARPQCTVTLMDLDMDLRPDTLQDPCGLRGVTPRPRELPADPWPP